MGVNRERHFVARRAASAVIVLALAGSVGLCVRAQAQNPTSAANPFWGSVTAQPVTGEVLKLSLVDAVNRGLKNNLGLKEAENQEKSLHGEKNEVLQEFLPTITLTGDTGYYTHDLVVFGFSSGFLQQIGSSLYGGKLPAGISNITRDYLTDGQIHLQPDPVFQSGGCRVEGGGCGRARGVFRQDVGARRGRAAGSDGVSARDCRRERG